LVQYAEQTFDASVATVGKPDDEVVMVQAVAPGGQEVTFEALDGCRYVGQLVEVTIRPCGR